MILPNSFKELLKEDDLYRLAETLCQPKHSKRLITDVAISKVPYIVFPEMDLNQSLIVHELAEQVLSLAKKENNHNEISITYSFENKQKIEDGIESILSKAGICKGTESETDIMSNPDTCSIIRRAKDAVIVNLHNHPSCSTFSIQDISLFLYETAIKWMVILGNNGEMYYLTKKKNLYNHDNARKYFVDTTRTIVPDINSREKLSKMESLEIAEIFLKNCYHFGIEYKHALGTNRHLSEVKKESDLNEAR